MSLSHPSRCNIKMADTLRLPISQILNSWKDPRNCSQGLSNWSANTDDKMIKMPIFRTNKYFPFATCDCVIRYEGSKTYWVFTKVVKHGSGVDHPFMKIVKFLKDYASIKFWEKANKSCLQTTPDFKADEWARDPKLSSPHLSRCEIVEPTKLGCAKLGPDYISPDFQGQQRFSRAARPREGHTVKITRLRLSCDT